MSWFRFKSWSTEVVEGRSRAFIVVPAFEIEVQRLVREGVIIDEIHYLVERIEGEGFALGERIPARKKVRIIVDDPRLNN